MPEIARKAGGKSPSTCCPPVYQAFSLAFQEPDNDNDLSPRKMRVKLPLLGSHQQINAAVALTALMALDRDEGDDRIEVSKEAIQRGFANVQWPARSTP